MLVNVVGDVERVPLYPEAFLMGSVHTFSEQTLDVIITRSTVSTFLQVGWVSIWASGEIILFPNFVFSYILERIFTIFLNFHLHI